MFNSLYEVWDIFNLSLKKMLDSFSFFAVEFIKLDLLSIFLSFASAIPLFLIIFFSFSSSIEQFSSALISGSSDVITSIIAGVLLSPIFIVSCLLYFAFLLAISPVFSSISLYKYLLVDSKLPKINLYTYITSNYRRFLIFNLLTFSVILVFMIPALLFAFAIPFIGFCLFLLFGFLLLLWMLFSYPYASVEIATTSASPMDALKNSLKISKKFPAKTFFYIVISIIFYLPFLVLDFVFNFVWALFYEIALSNLGFAGSIFDVLVSNLGSYLLVLPFSIFWVLFVSSIWKSTQK